MLVLFTSLLKVLPSCLEQQMKTSEKCCNRLLTKFQPNDPANNMSHRTRLITAYYSSKLDHHTVLYYKRQTCIRSVGVTSYKIENYTIAIFLAQKYIKSILIQRKQKKMLMVGHQPHYKKMQSFCLLYLTNLPT